MNLKTTLQDLRRKALSSLISEMMTDLESEGFDFRDLLLALADWAESNPQGQGAAYHLEQAAIHLIDHNQRKEQPEQQEAG